MDQYSFVRSAHRVYGKSIAAIARETGHDRKTVRKALQGEYVGYSQRRSQPFPAVGPYMAIIDGWLLADLDAPPKQRHTGVRVYERLRAEHGYHGCDSAVRRYVRQAKERLGLGAVKAFVPCDPACAVEAEVDWGQADVLLAGQLARVRVFCMRSKFSAMCFVRLYRCEQQQILFDGHMRAFEFFGGVFPVLVYDNLSTAVRKILKGRERQEQEAFRRFRGYYSFEARFCSPGQAHEKGGVEGLVGFARRNFLVPVPAAESLEALNEELLGRCLAYTGRTVHGREEPVGQLFAQERPRLAALPAAPFANQRITQARVSGYATVMVGQNRYSVPTRHAGRQAKVLLGVDEVAVCVDGRRVARHARLYGTGKWQLDPEHYLELLLKRPGAFETARPILAWRPSWPAPFEALLAAWRQRLGESAGVKEFVRVLLLVRDHGQAEVAAAAELALENNIRSCEGLRQLLVGLAPQRRFPPLADWPGMPPPDVAAYGRLGAL